MSFRIETLEQLKDPVLLEKVTDRLRRTTKARKFIFKIRCKALDGRPVLLSAPPGRKVKSTLVRELRLGTPTLKGVVHREGKILHFTFSSEVNKNKTQRWIAHFLQKTKSPVPLHQILILCPSDLKNDTSKKDVSKTKKTAPKMDEPPPIEDSILDIDWNQESQEEIIEDIDLDEIHKALQSDNELDRMDALQEEMDLLSQIIAANVPKIVSSNLQKLRANWETQQERVEEILEKQSNIEARMSDFEEEIKQLEEQYKNEEQMQKNDIWTQKIQAWKDLEKKIKASDLRMDTLRQLVSESSLSVQTLSKELQFIEDDWDAFLLIREFCTIERERLEQERLNSPKRLAIFQEKIKQQEELLVENKDKLDSLKVKLTRNNTRLDKKESLYWEEQIKVLLSTAQSMLHSDSTDMKTLLSELSASDDKQMKEIFIAISQFQKSYTV